MTAVEPTAFTVPVDIEPAKKLKAQAAETPVKRNDGFKFWPPDKASSDRGNAAPKADARTQLVTPLMVNTVSQDRGIINAGCSEWSDRSSPKEVHPISSGTIPINNTPPA